MVPLPTPELGAVAVSAEAVRAFRQGEDDLAIGIGCARIAGVGLFVKGIDVQPLRRQALLTAAVGMAGYMALGSSVALAGGLFIGWTLARMDLRSRAETVRLRIAQELPEFVQLMAAEAASGAGLETVPRRAANGTSATAAWLRGVLDQATGKSLFAESGTGALRQTAEESGHPGLVSLAIQLGFVGRGVQVQSLLKSLAQTFADEFIAQAETRAEKLSSSLGVMAAIFYFMPFVITVLVVVGVPLIQTITGS
ncbi:MAG: hypothetical protein AB1531_05850 [Chloroflexota bacterium]